jgi:protein CWC15
MTTAHRPTWNTARGNVNTNAFVSTAVSSKNQNAHMKLKYRQLGQASQDELRAKITCDGKIIDPMRSTEAEELAASKVLLAGAGGDDEKIGSSSSSTRKEEILDVDEDAFGYHSESEAGSDDDGEKDGVNGADIDSDDSDSDDELALQRELEKIKAERAAEAARQEEEEAAERAMTAATGNPLMNLGEGQTSGSSSKMKRQWNDDVVFRNQTRGEPQQKKRFINDAIRSDFHKSFMKKYIQ